MEITINKALESYVIEQVKTGNFKSKSDVIKEALEHHATNYINQRINNWRHQVLNGEMIEANENFFKWIRTSINKDFNVWNIK